MAIGTSRRNSFGKEKSGWGAFFTTIKTNAISGATTLILNGSGGSSFGVPTVAVGMKVWFLEDMAEAGKAISAVSIASGDATLTISALTNAQNAGKKVVVGYAADTALLLDAFSSSRNMNKWSPMPYSGTRAKNVGRRKGRIESDGSVEFMLRPSVNAGIMAKAVGQDLNVIGTDPTVPVTTTVTSGGTVGSTSVVVASAAGLVVGDFVQFETGTAAEVRKIGTIVTNTLTLDVGLDYAHAASSAVKKVIAPFMHTIPSAANKLDSVALEDYVPYDDEALASGVTSKAYYVPGAVFKGLSLESQAEQGVSVSMDYEAQDKVKIPSSTALAIPSEDPYTFEQEIILIGGTRNYRVMETSVQLDNDLQKVFTKQGSNRAFAIKAGQQEVTGALKFYLNDQTNNTFWDALENDTNLALVWQIKDPVTGYYTQVTCNKIVIDEFNDGDFSPSDLINGEVSFTAVLDAGSTNVQLTLVIANGYHLPY